MKTMKAAAVRLRPFTDILMIILVTVLPHFAQIPMLIYPPAILLVLSLYLRWTGQTFADIGFRFSDLSVRSFVIGCLVGIVWALFVYFLLGPLILRITGLPPADLSDFNNIRQSSVQFILLLTIAWLLVIPYEEIIFRGFVFTSLRRLTGERFWLAGFIHSLIFAAYHWQEGGSAVISIFIGAMLTIALYRKFAGNLWYLIFFHAAYDTVILTLFRYGLL
jgi:uncharacterized protein